MIAELEIWQASRLAELQASDSWLGLIGLFWLKPGLNSVGSGADTLVRLPAGPDFLGAIDWQADKLWWRPASGEAVRLHSDRGGDPDSIAWGSLSFFVVDREGQLAARVRDREWANAKPPVALQYFPGDPDWCIEAEWLAVDPPLRMEVPNVSGELKMVTVDRRAVFSVGGQLVELLPMSVGEREVFFVFRDRTSGKETYGAGRFLKAEAPVKGRIRLDFNRAYNPPCAFTPFATCPLPPPENWLPFAVPAGERKWEKQG
ncbi:MAG: hypothetical protein CVU34_14730 [Betaproteobacteria bacterium HGW-Betaproteobacteria-7]|jgi:hypothetical protein|nr:MAG: hypothetical protein CVU34_14730 [Betaproteobacteria bacterium HGW-Betaproteobacteria-7]